MSSRAWEGRKQLSTTKTCLSPMMTVVLPLGGPPRCSISYTPSANFVMLRPCCADRDPAAKRKMRAAAIPNSQDEFDLDSIGLSVEDGESLGRFRDDLCKVRSALNHLAL